MEAAVLNSLRTPADLASAWKAATASPTAFRAQLAGMIGRANDAALLATVADDLAAAKSDAGTVELLTSLRDGLARSKGDWRGLAASPAVEVPDGSGGHLLADASAASAARVAAVRLLALLPTPDSQSRLQAVLEGGKADSALAAALVAAVSDLDFLIARFASLESSARDELGGRILGSAQSSTAFLEAIRSGKVTLDTAPASLIENPAAMPTPRCRRSPPRCCRPW